MTTLVARSAKAMAWLLAGQWVVRVFGLASTIVLARLLAPADFGLVAVATSYLALVDGLSTFHVGQCLIRLRAERRSLFDTAWTLGMARGVFLALLMIASSRVAADFVGDPRLAAVIQVIGLTPVIGGLSNPRFVTFEKQVDFSRLALVEMSTKLISVTSMIVAAVMLRDYWALVAGTVISSAARAVLTYVMLPYLPRFCLAEAKRVLPFVGWLSLANAINTISSTLDNFIVARFLGIKDAGLYHMTRQVADLPTTAFIAPAERVFFASFAEIAHDPDRLRSKVLEVLGLIASIAVPCALGLALVAPQFVPLVLGQQWTACIPFLQVILPFFAISMVVTTAVPAAMAAGATQLVFRTALYYSALRLPIFIACVANLGLMGAMSGLALISVYWWGCNFWLLNKTVSLTMRQLTIAVHRPLVSAALMAGTILAMQPLLKGRLVSPSWFLLFSEVAAGSVLYTSAHVALWFVEGRPPGLESRFLQLLRRPRPAH